MEAKCRQSKLSTAEREQALRLKSRAVELLPDGVANLAKLQVGLVLGLDQEGQRWKGPACMTCAVLPPFTACGREQCPAGHPFGGPVGKAPGPAPC